MLYKPLVPGFISEILITKFCPYPCRFTNPMPSSFHQYCDIHVPEIQKLLEEAILTGANKVCSEKYGWLPAGVVSSAATSSRTSSRKPSQKNCSRPGLGRGGAEVKLRHRFPNGRQFNRRGDRIASAFLLFLIFLYLM
nr:uncharacterized protein LOC113815968 [Penaeus vannamei]